MGEANRKPIDAATRHIMAEVQKLPNRSKALFNLWQPLVTELWTFHPDMQKQVLDSWCESLGVLGCDIEEIDGIIPMVTEYLNRVRSAG